MTLISRDIRVLHLEPCDVCQAACPACAREIDPSFDRHQQHHLRPNQIEDIIPRAVLARLDKMFMCGNYGDPAAGRHTLDIYRFFRSMNPSITLGMNTNGAIHDPPWWSTLGLILYQPRDYVVFSIDGLADTNSVYRRGVNWHKLMANAEAYIATGAQAHWDMLVYQHNEHQVDDCERLARRMGFAWFRAKVSRRPLTTGLAWPQKWQRPDVVSTQVRCHALEEKSAYIDSRGRVWPCCWIGSTTNDTVVRLEDLQQNWHTPQAHATCVSTCGVSCQRSNFTAQWQREIEFHV